MSTDAAGARAGMSLPFPSPLHGSAHCRHMLAAATLVLALMTSAAANAASTKQHDADTRVSLRIVEGCDPAAAPRRTCDRAGYEDWLKRHAAPPRVVVDERGGQVLEVHF